MLKTRHKIKNFKKSDEGFISSGNACTQLLLARVDVTGMCCDVALLIVYPQVYVL